MYLWLSTLNASLFKTWLLSFLDLCCFKPPAPLCPCSPGGSRRGRPLTSPLPGKCKSRLASGPAAGHPMCLVPGDKARAAPELGDKPTSLLALGWPVPLICSGTKRRLHWQLFFHWYIHWICLPHYSPALEVSAVWGHLKLGDFSSSAHLWDRKGCQLLISSRVVTTALLGRCL